MVTPPKLSFNLSYTMSPSTDVEVSIFSELSYRLQQFTNLFTDAGMEMDDEQMPLRKIICAQLQELLSMMLGDNRDSDAGDGSLSEQEVVLAQDDNLSVHIALLHSRSLKCS
jgi:hypothetical protein